MIAISAIPAFRAVACITVLAFVLSTSQAFAERKRDCETSLRLKPGDKEFLLSRGICHLNSGEADLAISDFDRFIDRNPGWVAGYFNRGNAYFAKADYDLAIADYDAALRRQPSDPEGIIWNRGNAYAEKRDYRQAIADYDQAIRVKPGFADYHRIRAEVHEKAGEKDLAILDYRKALSLEPENRAALNGLEQLTKASPVPSPETLPHVSFYRPRYGNFRLDWCRYWARRCGKAAADEFCRRLGFADSSTFAQDPHIGKDDPTTVIGSGQVCSDRSCNGFAKIACRK